MIGRFSSTVVLQTARERERERVVAISWLLILINYVGARILAKCVLFICYKLVGGWTFKLRASVCTFLLYTFKKNQIMRRQIYRTYM